jgi:hypothetical protein
MFVNTCWSRVVQIAGESGGELVYDSKRRRTDWVEFSDTNPVSGAGFRCQQSRVLILTSKGALWMLQGGSRIALGYVTLKTLIWLVITENRRRPTIGNLESSIEVPMILSIFESWCS